MSKRKTKEEFIEEAMNVHGDRYCYDQVEYSDSNTKVRIVCPIHGVFEQTPSKHLHGQGCPECGRIKRAESNTMTTDEFIKKSIEVHGEKYDYSKTVYERNDKDVTIICRVHGEFRQKPIKHLSGQGCPLCANNTTMSNVEFIKKARLVHGDRYDYSKVDIISTHAKVEIICPKHGIFLQTPKEHLRGRGCRLCGNEAKRSKLNLDRSLVVQRLLSVSNGRYIVPDTIEYKNDRSKIKVICPVHGEWETTPSTLWKGAGCPKCANQVSRPEEEIRDFLLKFLNKDDVIERDRSVLGRQELDLFIPKLNLAIEYNGLRWHSQRFKKDKNYHLNKLERCNEKGIRLIQIFEDEWLEKKDVVLSKIGHIIGCDGGKRIFARKCTVEAIKPDTAKIFLEKNHIQGYGRSTVYYGAYYEDKLVSVMSFLMESEGMWNLTRFATDNSCVCVGIGGKLFSRFLKDHNPTQVKSFADRRWTLDSEDNIYTKLGFRLDDILPPEYRYINGTRREHKFGYRKDRLHKKYGISMDMTELEMTRKLGFDRIYDCGLFKYVWKRGI